MVDAYRRFVWEHLGRLPAAKVEFVVAGGGAKNDRSNGDVADGLEPLGVQVRMMEELGVPAQAKEACGVCAAGVADVAWIARKRSFGYGSEESCGAGEVKSRMNFSGWWREADSLRECPP